MASGVTRKEAVIMATVNPGVSFSMTLAVASGVTSLGPIPVPPVVITSCSLRSSLQCFKVFCTWYIDIVNLAINYDPLKM